MLDYYHSIILLVFKTIITNLVADKGWIKYTQTKIDSVFSSLFIRINE